MRDRDVAMLVIAVALLAIGMFALGRAMMREELRCDGFRLERVYPVNAPTYWRVIVEEVQ